MAIATVAVLIFFIYHYDKHYLETKDPSLKSYIAYMSEWIADITGRKK